MSEVSKLPDLVASNLMLVEIVRKLVLGNGSAAEAAPSSVAVEDAISSMNAAIGTLGKRLEACQSEVGQIPARLVEFRSDVDDAIRRALIVSVSKPVTEAVIDARKMFEASQVKPNLECAIVPEVLSGISKPVPPTTNEKPAPLGGQLPAPTAKLLGPMHAVEHGPEFTLPVIPKNRRCIIMGKEVISRSGRHTCTKANTAKMVGKLGGGGTHFIGDLARDYGFGDEAKARSALVGLKDHLWNIGLHLHLTDHEASLFADLIREQ